MCEKRDIGGYAVAEMAKFGVFSLIKVIKKLIFCEKLKNNI